MKTNNSRPLSRKQRLASLSESSNWDVIIIGGGVTGAGILKLASQVGLNALLLEQKDFAWGSSSRSSKMVHGGLRYIAEGKIKLTRESVRERQRLLNEAQGLVTQQSFVMSHYFKQFPRPWMFNLLLWMYDLFSGKKQRQFWPKKNYQYLMPGVKTKHLIGGSQFSDAMTDDSRLVIRLIQEAQQKSASAINYTKVIEIQKQGGRVVGVIAQPQEQTTKIKLKAKIVVNASGAWNNEFFSKTERTIRLRPLRGSHIIVPSWRLPVASALMLMHPKDKRPVLVFPWQNVTVIGTTDVEHQQSLSYEPHISQEEFDYLLAGVEDQFPHAKLSKQDIISTFAGVRPVIASVSGAAPSQESREHFIDHTPGLINIAGGKLTTFHLMAKQVLKSVLDEIQPARNVKKNEFDFPVFEPFKKSRNSELPDYTVQHIEACYGQLTDDFIADSNARLLNAIGYSRNLWAELVWAVKHEQIVHLDDLLLRRLRIGLVLPEGGIKEMNIIKQLCSEHLSWSESKWSREIEDYRKLWKSCYSLPFDDQIRQKKA